ncbi:T9SS type A sorting domain-containing protein [Aquimarina sp. RZ0]|uniref:DUF7452 domain-containing protein n=1 Tax=Aquimarina sp. RZ0 TaxID=2607730 RepID=UPI0011F0BA32|nr:T9SS type A sorting domain-containing protein [Aquimarina sp. RZ0]KAA1243490.1 T9SS type A sorting domain-containing protein [Aquimarina sp. RZ0]
MKNLSSLFTSFGHTMSLTAVLALFFGTLVYAQPSTFKHIATSTNTSGHVTTIDNPRTNNRPNAILFVTHDYGSGPYNIAPVGVYYYGGKWRIFNQNRATIDTNTTFNVLTQTPADTRVFIHSSTSANTNNHITTIDHPATNNKPSAKIVLTQFWTSTYNPHSVGVYYYAGKWRIFNQDLNAMPVGAKFNIIVDHTKSFIHTAASNSTSHITTLNDFDTNNRPGSFVFATNNWGTNGPYNPHEVGVWYNGGRWKLYNEDLTTIPSNAKFNIIAFDLSAPNISGYYTCDDGGHYYIRQTGQDVYWFGEHPSGGWANVFKGSINGYQITGQFYDVPKGRIQGTGTLSLAINPTGTSLSKTGGSGFGGSLWSKTTRPTSLPGTRPAGFHTINNQNILNGKWRGNDNGSYYIRQIGNTVVWFGERNYSSGIPGWANVAVGTRTGNTIQLNWSDIPKGNAGGRGTLTLFVRNKNEITRSAVTGGFGGSNWKRGAEELPSSIASQFGYGTMTVNGKQARGSRPLLVIRNQYSDMRFHNPHTTSYYDTMFFGTGMGSGNPSVREYFKENSFNNFTFHKADIVTVTMEDNPRTAINESLLNCSGRRMFNGNSLCPGVTGRWEDDIPKIIELASSRARFDFSRYDTNGDKIITADELQIVIMGADIPISGTTATHPASFADSGANRWSGNANFRGGYSYRGSVAVCGEGTGFATLVHEISHSLGTIDLYGARFRLNQSSTIMSGTITSREDDTWSINMDSYHKMRLGWVEPRIYQITDGGGSMVVNANTLAGNALTDAKRPVILYDPSKGTNEYFMLEARQQASSPTWGFDNQVSGSGIKVWRVKTKSNHLPKDNRIILRGNNGRIESRRSGDDIAVTNASGTLWEIHNGQNDSRNTTLRGDDTEGHDFQLYTISPDTPLPGRGRSWLQTDGNNTRMIWSNGNNSRLKLSSYDSSSAPGFHIVDWLLDTSISTRSSIESIVAKTLDREKIDIPQFKGACAIDYKKQENMMPGAQSSQIDFESIAKKNNQLLSNSPNPFRDQTVFSIQLAPGFISGSIQVTDITGKTIEKIQLKKDQKQVNFQKGTLNAGIYFYSLIVNEKIIKTNKMIIAN